MQPYPEDIFHQLYHKYPSDKERQRLLNIKAALQLSDTDELWRLIMVLDHYDQSIVRNRLVTSKEVKRIIDELNLVPNKSGQIAYSEAQSAVRDTIGSAKVHITKIIEEKLKSQTFKLSKMQIALTLLFGALLAILINGTGALTMYFFLKQNGICSEPPAQTKGGSIVCYVERFER